MVNGCCCSSLNKVIHNEWYLYGTGTYQTHDRIQKFRFVWIPVEWTACRSPCHGNLQTPVWTAQRLTWHHSLPKKMLTRSQKLSLISYDWWTFKHANFQHFLKALNIQTMWSVIIRLTQKWDDTNVIFSDFSYSLYLGRPPLRIPFLLCFVWMFSSNAMYITHKGQHGLVSTNADFEPGCKHKRLCPSWILPTSSNVDACFTDTPEWFYQVIIVFFSENEIKYFWIILISVAVLADMSHR